MYAFIYSKQEKRRKEKRREGKGRKEKRREDTAGDLLCTYIDVVLGTVRYGR